MYYLIIYSFILSLFIFGILQYLEKRNIENSGENYDIQKNIFSKNSSILFFILFLMNVIILYYVLFDEKNNTISFSSLFSGGGTKSQANTKVNLKDVKPNNIVDPLFLKRINEPIHCGFEPYSGGSDGNSISGTSCSSSSSSSS